MGFTIVAVALGLLAGLLSGGRPRYLAERRIAAWPLLPGGLLLQVASGHIGADAGLAILLTSYACLLAFVVANLALVGMPLVLIGLALNCLAISVNAGMPVKRSAIVAAGISRTELAHLHVTGKHHLSRSSDHLVVLSDIIPVRPLHEVLSFGDLIMSVGVADVLAQLLRPRPARAARPDEEAAPQRTPFIL